jgi:hypothetical protein
MVIQIALGIVVAAVAFILVGVIIENVAEWIWEHIF